MTKEETTKQIIETLPIMVFAGSMLRDRYELGTAVIQHKGGFIVAGQYIGWDTARRICRLPRPIKEVE
jgi:hypothetical protein